MPGNNDRHNSSGFPLEIFWEFARGLHRADYYCHPAYNELHKLASAICDNYKKKVKKDTPQDNAELANLLKRWLHKYNACSGKRAAPPVRIDVVDVCAICLVTPGSGDAVRRCSERRNHIFHEDCVIEYYAAKKEENCLWTPQCPTCRGLFEFEYDICFAAVSASERAAAAKLEASRKDAIYQKASEQGWFCKKDPGTQIPESRHVFDDEAASSSCEA